MLSHICVVKSDCPNWNVEFFLYLSAAIRIHALELEILDYLGTNGEKGDQSIVEFLTKTVLYHFKHVKQCFCAARKRSVAAAARAAAYLYLVMLINIAAIAQALEAAAGGEQLKRGPLSTIAQHQSGE